MRQEAMFRGYPDKSGIPKMLSRCVLEGKNGGRESTQVNAGLLKGKRGIAQTQGSGNDEVISDLRK